MFASRLQKQGHDVAVAAFHGLHGSPMQWKPPNAPDDFKPVTVYPGSAEDLWAQDVMLGHYQRHQAELLITLMDQWVLDPNIMLEYKKTGMRMAHWIPVDCEPLGKLDYRNLSMTRNIPIAISKFGEQQLKEFNPLYVPHGVDTTVFRPLPDVREETRERAKFTDKFIIGINAANQDPVRKAFGEQLCAFRLFHDKYPESKLLMHTRRNARSGSDLDRLIGLLHLEDAVEFGDQYLTVSGVTTQDSLNQWYNVLDVFSLCSYGEGFGVPVVEAQAAGTPVSVTDCSSLTELCGSGWKVDGDFYWNAGHGAWWTKPFVRAIADAWERALLAKQDGSMPAMREKAREFALQYDADLVAEQYWKPALEQLAGPPEPDTIEHAGLKWRVENVNADRADRLGPFHEETVEDQVLDLLPEGGVFLDIGAHVGHYTLRAAVKASKVIAVEPNPATASRLRDNIALNVGKIGQQKVLIHQLAAWDKIERLQLESETGHERDGSTKVVPGADGTVTGLPLDKILSSEPRIDLVKMDVEGADLHALRGMAQTLARLHPVMVIEDHSVYGDYKKEDLEALLSELGYDCQDLGMYGCAPYLVARPVTVPV